MHVLNSIEVLHENPYTGDKITKAKIVSIDKTILPPVEKSSGHEPPSSNQDSKAQPDENDTGDIPHTSASLPRYVAIKYLSDYRKKSLRKKSSSPRAPGQGWSSDSSYCSSDSSDGEAEDGEEGDDILLDGNGCRLVPPLGYYRVPNRIRFGIKAKREIKALKAAQGHPSIIKFLGFTNDPVENPLKAAKEPKYDMKQQQRSTSLPAPSDLFTQPRNSLGESAPLGSAATFGGSLFLDNGTAASSESGLIAPPSSFRDLQGGGSNDSGSSPGAVIHWNSRFDSDSDYDSCNNGSSGSDQEGPTSEKDQGTTTSNVPMKRKKKATNWNRVYSRQPRVGGILLPYLPLTVQDLIRIGWTKSRPLLVETCMRQILEGLAWIHDSAGLIHRDISPGNIMVGLSSTDGLDDEGWVQCMISDFGCATFHPSRTQTEKVGLEQDGQGARDPEPEKEEEQPVSHLEQLQSHQQPGLTFEVGTRAYRAPELLFSSGDYTNAVDLWSAGVVFAEMYLGKTLFEAESDIGQVCAIVKVLGTPKEENWPEYTSMPDHGKLVFTVKKTDPLWEHLLGADYPRLSPTTEEQGNNGTGEHPTDGQSSEEAASDHCLPSPPSSPPTLISRVAFELIDGLIKYSALARLTAAGALAFKDHYLSRTCTSKEETDGNPLYLQLKEQCALDSRHILLAKEQLKKQEEEESDEYGYEHGFGGGQGDEDQQDDDDDSEPGYRPRPVGRGSAVEAGQQDYGLHPGLSFGRSIWEEADEEDDV